MKSQRMIQAATVGAICLLIAAGVMLTRRPKIPELPAVVHYAKPEVFNRALQKARAAITHPASDPAGVRRLARLYHANRLYAEARACYAVIAAVAPGLTARDHYYLADLARNEGDLPAAQQEFTAVLQTEPGYLPAHLALAEVLFKTGHEDEAAKEYSAALGIDSGNPQASIGLARLELQRGDDAAAVMRLENLMAAHFEFTTGAGLLAQVLERRGDPTRANVMREWSRQKPEPIPADPWLDALLPDCYDLQRLSLLFEEYFKTGQMKEALPLLDRLAELDPKSPIPKMFTGFSHAQSLQHITAVREYYEALGNGGDPEKIVPMLATSLLALGKTTEAATLLADFHTRMPASVPITTAYADVATRQGDDKTARVLLAEVLKTEPYVYAPNMNLAKILWQAGERDEAAKYLQRIVQVFPDDVPSRGLLGQYYLEKGDAVSAITPLEQALTHAPAAARADLVTMLDAAYVQAGNAMTDKNQFAPAADYFDKAAQLAPADLKAWAGAANAAVQLKQFGRAAGALEKMTALQPDNPTIYLSLGDVLYQDGDRAKATQQWQHALQFAAADDGELRQAIADRLAGRITAETFK